MILKHVKYFIITSCVLHNITISHVDDEDFNIIEEEDEHDNWGDADDRDDPDMLKII